MSRLVSSLPGRIRVRDKALRHPDRLAHVHASLARMPGVSDVQSNAATGSVLLHFDGQRIDVDDLEAQVDSLIDQAPVPPRAKSRRALRLRVNQIAKAGMLGSLASSLALAAAGQKKWHAATGCVFVACLGAYLTVHRKHVFR